MYEYNSIEDVIALLKNRDLSHFHFADGKAFAEFYTEEWDAVEICADAPDRTIPAETVKRMLDVLNNLDAYIRKAYGWLKNLNTNDKWLAHKYPQWFPDEMDQIYEKELILYGLHFGKIRRGHDPNPVADGFMISLMERDCEGWTWVYTVKFVQEDMRPAAVERWIKIF